MTFNYSMIPGGFYDQILHGPDGIRKFWHYHKFESVLRYIPNGLVGEGRHILDMGCFGGSFLGMIPKTLFSEQLGLDILSEQIQYARENYGTDFRKFEIYTDDIFRNKSYIKKFHVITLIEVIEHLHKKEIHNLISVLLKLLHPDGVIIITTPNYTSFWPVIELLLNSFSDISYEEQHLSKFTYFNLEKKLSEVMKEHRLNCNAKTTTHFISPFMAGISYPASRWLATKIPASGWRNPFGNIILSRWSYEA
jgi:2-polyprenyl-3-methyl-5-hydroxy-6-metoxy-1,4-benzoquinol methylase